MSFLIIMAILLTGCNKDRVVSADASEKPLSEIKGFYSADQILAGGSSIPMLNLADIKIETVDSTSVKVVISFAEGNAALSMSEYPSAGVPLYQTSYIEGLDRLVIKLDKLAYWTYRLYDDELDNYIVNGIFHQKPVGGDSTYLYICIKDDFAYKIDEYKNQLIITLAHIEEQPSYAWYVLANAYQEYEDGLIGEQTELYPILCNDGSSKVLISRPMQTRDEAEAFIEQKLEAMNNAAPGKSMSVVQLSNNQLPSYSAVEELAEIVNTPIGQIDNELKLFPTLIVDGRFLAWDRSYEKYLFAKPFTISGAQEGDYYKYEQIWEYRGSDSKALLDYTFSSILDAKYSYDGKYVAFIDQNENMRMLYVYSIEDGRLYIPAEDGFGVDTASFTWANDKNVLYAITGEYSSKQLMCYDMSDIGTVYALAEQEFPESDLYYHNGFLFYSSLDALTLSKDIMRIDTATGEITRVSAGYSFELSPDGSKIAINDIVENDGRESGRLTYIEMDFTGSVAEHVISTGQTIMDVAWSRNGKRLYYTVYRNAGWMANFPYALYYYDIDSDSNVYVMDMTNGTLYKSNNDTSILVMRLYPGQNKQIPVTYIVKE